MTTAITKTEVKNSKKGFTLVELVVVIAILAILAAIAIPVVSTIINTSSKNAALTDAQTLELAIKEAQADMTAKNPDTYGNKAVSRTIQIADIAKQKAINSCFETKTVNNKSYAPCWCSTDAKVYFCTNASSGAAVTSGNTGTDVEGTARTNLTPLSTAAGAAVTTNASTLASPASLT